MDIPRHVVAVEGIIADAQNRVLLKRHPQRGWEFPGGKVEVGEDLLTALAREVEEEVGIAVEVRRLAAVYTNTVPFSLVLFSFLANYQAGELRLSEESLDIRWFERERILEYVTFPPTRHRAGELIREDGPLLYRAYEEPQEAGELFHVQKEYIF